MSDTPEAVGYIEMTDGRITSMHGIGGSDQLTVAEVRAALEAPLPPGVTRQAMVLWDSGSNGHGTLWQIEHYWLADFLDAVVQEEDDEDE